MMSEPSGRQIRSYHRAFHFELMLYTLGNLGRGGRFPRKVSSTPRCAW